MVKSIKDVHKEDVCMYKIGSFYNAYGKDAYILSYLFEYNIKSGKDNIAICGFPAQAISKIMAKLEQRKINYITLDVRNNYDVDETSDNDNLNTYNEVLEKATRYVKLKRRIDDINSYLLEEIEKDCIKDKIRKIEDIIYEDREI